MLRLPPPLSFWIHSYLSKRRRYGGICLHFPYMIERDFLEIVAVKLKRHSVVGGGKCINLCGYILLPPEIYIAEILYCLSSWNLTKVYIFSPSSPGEI